MQGPPIDQAVSIAGLSTVLGEHEVTASALASAHGTSESTILRSLGGARVYSSERDLSDIALDAARLAIARADLAPSALSALAFIGGDPLSLQHALGASSAFTLESGSDCTSLLAATHAAYHLIRGEPGVNAVMLAAAERRGDSAQRTIGKIDEQTTRDVFSDGGAAFVLRRGGERLVMLGVGAATDGTYQSHWNDKRKGVGVSDVEVMVAALPLFREGFARCLRSANVERAAIDILVFPSEGATLPYTFARTIGMPREKVFIASDAPSHVGASDLVFSLEHLLVSDLAKPGSVVLVCARTIGVVRFAMLRL
jgi:3-oxoacyl-[acyl-carrier-protein] synthase III